MTEFNPIAETAGLERSLHQLAADFPYPETPQFSVLRRSPRPGRQLRLAGAILLAVVLILASVPPVRAAVGEVLRVGVVRIFQGESAAAPSQVPLQIPAGALTVLDLPGETSLAAARRAVDFELPISAELGPPDRVFLLDRAGPAVVMVWLDPDQPDFTLVALYVFPPESVLRKLTLQTIETVTVDGQDAIWASGAHYIELPLDGQALRLYVPGGVLIWTEQSLTYRLETIEPLDRAITLAESLR